EGQVTVFCNAAMREEEQKSLSQSKSLKTASPSAKHTNESEPTDQPQDDESAGSRRIKSPAGKDKKHAPKKNAGSGAGKDMADAQENGAAALPSMAALAVGAALGAVLL
ncbi:hypothetical protein IW150_003907, partial [Coemansia sp. RSA 2607]